MRKAPGKSPGTCLFFQPNPRRFFKTHQSEQSDWWFSFPRCLPGTAVAPRNQSVRLTGPHGTRPPRTERLLKTPFGALGPRRVVSE